MFTFENISVFILQTEKDKVLPCTFMFKNYFNAELYTGSLNYAPRTQPLAKGKTFKPRTHK